MAATERNSGTAPRREMVIAYRLQDSLYLNITNRCPNACQFCVRESEDGVGYNLWLEHEPDIATVLSAIEREGDPASFREIVFCGYGEPLLRPDVVVAVAKEMKRRGARVRINTNGLADLFLGYDILPELSGLVDTISISLNAENSGSYLELTRSKFKEKAFPALLDFCRRSLRYIPRVVLSVVRYPGVDLKQAAAIAAEIGAEFRIREYIP